MTSDTVVAGRTLTAPCASKTSKTEIARLRRLRTTKAYLELSLPGCPQNLSGPYFGQGCVRDKSCPEPTPGQLVLMNCHKTKLKREGRSSSPIAGYVAPKRNQAAAEQRPTKLLGACHCPRNLLASSRPFQRAQSARIRYVFLGTCMSFDPRPPQTNQRWGRP